MTSMQAALSSLGCSLRTSLGGIVGEERGCADLSLTFGGDWGEERREARGTAGARNWVWLCPARALKTEDPTESCGRPLVVYTRTP